MDKNVIAVAGITVAQGFPDNVLVGDSAEIVFNIVSRRHKRKGKDFNIGDLPDQNN